VTDETSTPPADEPGAPLPVLALAVGRTKPDRKLGLHMLQDSDVRAKPGAMLLMQPIEFVSELAANVQPVTTLFLVRVDGKAMKAIARSELVNSVDLGNGRRLFLPAASAPFTEI
jgi:hypothetical protein